ncbi:MAG TPA: benzoate-CoA ligase family protein [Acidimicrobiia bacterium]|nr:benzoate-CoA ligase family protein [Acidimicrobiia bacterium]
MTIAWPARLNIDDHLLRQRLKEGNGGRVALRLDDRDVTYAEVDRSASGYASLLADNGVGPGDRVLLVMPDGLEYVAALFGVLRSGAVGLLLNPGLTPSDLSAIAGLARATGAIVHRGHLRSYEAALTSAGIPLPPGVVVDDDLGLPDVDVPTYDTAALDPALWIFSGGTTGVPKAVVQTHRSFANTTELYGKGTLGLTAEDITIAVPKLYFGYAMGSNLFFPFSVGASAVLFQEQSTPEGLFDRIERHRATVLVNVPSAINQMLAHSDAADRDLSSLRVATSAGEALPDTLYHQWTGRFGVELLDGLGTAEMWHIFVSNRIGDVRPGTLGRAVPGFDIKVCDDDGEEVPAGEVGRLWVKGDSLGLGYFENPEATAEAFRGEWFAGGDLVSIDGGGYVTHRGRVDDAIKVKGRWFRPQEVESILLDHPAVNECAVVAITDAAGLAKPVAFVVATDVTEGELTDWALAHLEAYKHPRRIHFVDRLPQTHLGKVDRAALKSLAADG